MVDFPASYVRLPEGIFHNIFFQKPISFGISMLGFFFGCPLLCNMYLDASTPGSWKSLDRRETQPDMLPATSADGSFPPGSLKRYHSLVALKGFKLAPTLEGAGIYLYNL